MRVTELCIMSDPDNVTQGCAIGLENQDVVANKCAISQITIYFPDDVRCFWFERGRLPDAAPCTISPDGPTPDVCM